MARYERPRFGLLCSPMAAPQAMVPLGRFSMTGTAVGERPSMQNEAEPRGRSRVTFIIDSQDVE